MTKAKINRSVGQRMLGWLWSDGSTMSKGFGIALAVLTVALLIFVDRTGEDWREDWPDGAAKIEAGTRTKIKPAEMARTAAYWGAIAGAGISGLLLLTRPVWMGADRPLSMAGSRRGTGRDKSGHSRSPGDGVARIRKVSFWSLVVLAILVGLMLRLPRMTFSFYHDESHAYTRLIAGEWKQGAPGEDGAKFDRPTWGETGFGNNTGNNAFLYSITARAVYDWWCADHDLADGQVTEWLPRLPVLIAGLATIFVMGLAGRSVAGSWTGIAAAWLMALHPWAVRFSTEARAYGMALLFMALSIWLLAGIWKTNRWRWWLPYGLCQLLTVYTYPGAAFLVGLWNVMFAGLLFLALAGPRRDAAVTAIKRLSVSALLAAIPALMLLVAPVVNTKEALTTSSAMKGVVPDTWWGDSVSGLLVGSEWFNHTSTSPFTVAISYAIEQGYWLQVVAYALAVGLFVLGAVKLFRSPKTRAMAWVFAFSFASLGLLYLNSVKEGNALMIWYGVTVLPIVVLFMAAGIGKLAAVATGKGSGLVSAAPAIVLFLTVGWGICLARPISIYRQMGKANPRQVVRIARGGDFPEFKRDPITLSLWFDGETYDPFALRFPGSDREAKGYLSGKIAEAKAQKRELFVYVGTTHNVRSNFPKLWKRLMSGKEFGLVTQAYGLEAEDNHSYLFQLIGE